MSKPASTPLIGAFILAGVILLVVAIGFLGSNPFNSKQHSFVCFFEDSVNGLDVGTPVKFKGVTVGKVENILIRIENDVAIPVLITIDEKIFASRGILAHLEDPAALSSIIEKGLRAQLNLRSIITGQLYIELDIYPNSELVFRKKNDTAGPTEIPTIRSDMGTMMHAASQTFEQVSQVDFAGISEKIRNILDQVQNGVAEIEFKKINEGVLNISDSANAILNDTALRETAANLNATLRDFQNLANAIAAQAAPVSLELRNTTAAAQQAIAKFNQTAENLRIATQPGTGLRAELDETLAQLSEAARALRTLSDYIERHPNAIITGKAGNDEK